MAVIRKQTRATTGAHHDTEVLEPIGIAITDCLRISLFLRPHSVEAQLLINRSQFGNQAQLPGGKATFGDGSPICRWTEVIDVYAKAPVPGNSDQGDVLTVRIG